MNKLDALPEHAWFYWNQELLTEMAKTYYGRDLLCLNEGITDIVRILPNAVVGIKNGKGITELRTHNKYGKVVRHRWKEFCEYKDYIEDEMYRKAALGNLAMGLPMPVGGGTVTTLFPEPDPETNSVDGHCDHVAQGSSFATLVAGAGTFNNDSDASMFPGLILIDPADATDEYTILRRCIALFDDTSSAIPTGDNIDSAKLSLYGVAKSNALSGEGSDNSKIVSVSSAPASDTGLANGDYNSLGSTSFGESVIQSSFSNAAYNDITLNASGISNIVKSGLSKFGYQYKWDFGDTTTGLTHSTGSEITQSIEVRSAEQSGTSNDPILEVTHSSADPESSLIGGKLIGGGLTRRRIVA